MIELDRRNRIGALLVGVAVLLFVLPAIFPVQPMLTHNTEYSVPFGPAELEEEGFEIVQYSNLSDRGQELYVRTLERGGEVRVGQGEGAPDFAYPTDEERYETVRDRSSARPGAVAIERPADDGHLPPADERAFGGPSEDENRTEFRDRVTRYDAMQTGTELPALGAPAQLSRLVAALLAVVSLGVGGYLLSTP